MINMTGYDSGRRVPYRGMNYSDYSSILAQIGCHPVILKPRTEPRDATISWDKDAPSFHDIYSFVESGLPVIVSFTGHVATIIGHTLRDDFGGHARDQMNVGGTTKETRFYNSFSLVRQFVVVDDNFFPYQLLGFKSDPNNYGDRFRNQIEPPPSIDSIYSAVVPLPEKAFLPPDKARQLGYEYFSNPFAEALLDQVIELLGYDASEPLVARLFLTSSTSFKARKMKCVCGDIGEAPDKLAFLPVDLNLPHFIWVMEISPITEHKNRYCIAEVVIDASINQEECNFIYMRIGKRLIQGNKTADISDGHLRFFHYTHNLGEWDA